MGLIFDQHIAEIYESWYHSPHGRAIDRSIEQMLVTLLNPRPGERVLDIGCGTGNHLLTLSRLGLDISGLDAAPHMIARARERLGHHAMLRVGVARDLPFEDNEFDVVVLINSLEFLDDPIAALREACRVAFRKIFIGVINSLSWGGVVKRIQGCFGDPLFGKSRFYNIWQLKSLLKTAIGRTPVSWACTRIRPAFMDEMSPFGRGSREWNRSPFGSFLGISADMTYRVRTDGLPLTVRLRKAGRPLVGADSFLGTLNRGEGDPGNERGVSI